MLPMCGPRVAVWDLHPYVQCWLVTVSLEAAPRFGPSFQHETVGYILSNVSASLDDPAILSFWKPLKISKRTLIHSGGDSTLRCFIVGSAECQLAQRYLRLRRDLFDAASGFGWVIEKGWRIGAII